MSNKWQINPTLAAQYVPNQTTYINNTTMDTFTIKNAVWDTRQAAGGETKQLVLSLENDAGRTATNYILYKLEGKNSEQGVTLINAIGYLIGQQELSAAEGTYETYDPASQKPVQQRGFICPEMIGKRIGMVMYKRSYYDSKKHFAVRSGMSPFQVFDPVTKQTAAEKFEGKPGTDESLQLIFTAALESEKYFLDRANREMALAQGGANTANNGFGQANNGFGQANNGFGQANNGFGQANNGFGQANNGFTNTAGFGQANTTLMANTVPKAGAVDDDIPF